MFHFSLHSFLIAFNL